MNGNDNTKNNVNSNMDNNNNNNNNDMVNVPGKLLPWMKKASQRNQQRFPAKESSKYWCICGFVTKMAAQTQIAGDPEVECNKQR